MAKEGIRIRNVEKYDGQYIYFRGKQIYSLTCFLGSGSSSSVYEAVDSSKKTKSVAIKILNPVGYKLSQSTAIRAATILKKGNELSEEQKLTCQIGPENVYWLQTSGGSSKNIIAAYEVCLRVLMLDYA